MTEAPTRLGLESPHCLQADNRFRASVQQNGGCWTIFGNDSRPETLRKRWRTFYGGVRSALDLGQKRVVILRGRRHKQQAMARQVLTHKVHGTIFARTFDFGRDLPALPRTLSSHFGIDRTWAC